MKSAPDHPVPTLQRLLPVLGWLGPLFCLSSAEVCVVLLAGPRLSRRTTGLPATVGRRVRAIGGVI